MTSSPAAARCRAAVAADAATIAALHADSWRRNYRGAYRDSYLDGDVFADRRAVWTDRLDRPGPDDRTIVAELDGAVIGFSHTILDDDPTWGALLENLHVTQDLKRQRIGTLLLAESARPVLAASPPTGLHLWVLEQNVAAQAFYRRRGGSFVGQKQGGPFPGGGTAVVLRCAWPDPATLLGG